MKLCKSILATVSLLLALLILPGCALTMHSRDIEDAHFNEKGELVVTYKDGYVSWSPKEVFEEAYREVGEMMDFGGAIRALRAGCKTARAGWNGKKQYVDMATCISYKGSAGNVVNVEHNNIGNKALAFVGTSGVQMGWLASQADMLADDWYIVED